MKKYMIESFTKCKDGREYHETYECNGYEFAKNYTGECIRLDDVNSYKVSKTGKEQRKQFNKGKYINISLMAHWDSNTVYIWENGTDNVIRKFENR